MKTTLVRISVCVFFLLAGPGALRAQQATTKRNVILRRDPSTASPAVELLPKGARLSLVDQNPDSGFYHVRTEDDQVGWVSLKALTLLQAPTTKAQPAPSSQTPPANANCDANLDGHVYHPARLIVKQECMAVTGTIVDATAGKEPDGVRHEKDGDTHGWLKLDAEFQNLVNAGNIGQEDGNLVFEIVCKFPVTQTDAKAACQGYTDHVALPPVGSRVQIVGRYVQDTFHGQWMEIHPVTSITVIP